MLNESDCFYHSLCNSSANDTTLDTSNYVTPINSPNKSKRIQLSPTSNSLLSSASLGINSDDEDEDTQNQTDSYCTNELQHQLNSLRVNSTDSSYTLVPSDASSNPFVTNNSLFSSNNDKDIKQKCNRILDNLEQINSDYCKIENIEKQISALRLQFNELRESVSKQTLISVHLMRELILQIDNPSNISLKQSKDAQIQCKLPSIDDDSSKSMSILTNYENISSTRALSGREKNITENFETQTNFKLTKELKYKFRKLPAFAKGYLLRRLIKTETVENLKRTISDTSIILLNFKSNLFRDGKLIVSHQDILFHQRLCIQLERSCKEYYNIFFNTPIAKQMNMIAQHRIYLRSVKYLKDKRANSALSQTSSLARSHSSALSVSKKTQSRPKIRP